VDIKPGDKYTQYCQTRGTAIAVGRARPVLIAPLREISLPPIIPFNMPPTRDLHGPDNGITAYYDGNPREWAAITFTNYRGDDGDGEINHGNTAVTGVHFTNANLDTLHGSYLLIKIFLTASSPAH